MHNIHPMQCISTSPLILGRAIFVFQSEIIESIRIAHEAMGTHSDDPVFTADSMQIVCEIIYVFIVITKSLLWFDCAHRARFFTYRQCNNIYMQ